MLGCLDWLKERAGLDNVRVSDTRHVAPIHQCLVLVALCALQAFAPALARDHVVDKAWLDDPSARLSWSDVQRLPMTPYSGVLSRGFDDSALWVRLTSTPCAGRFPVTAMNSFPTSTELVLDSQTLWLSGPLGKVEVTLTESLLLAALSRSAGKKLERWQAMQLIDSKEKGLVAANLEMRISALRKKLSYCGANEDAIRTLRGFGYGLNCVIILN